MTVVLVPGLTCDSSYWAEQRGQLEAHGTVVVPRLHDCRSIDAMADVALSMSAGPLHVIGHSMGGRVAMAMYRLASERIASLALLDTGAHGVGDTEPQRRQHRLDIATDHGMAALAADWVPNMVHPDRVHDTALTEAITAMVTSYRVEQYHGQINALLTRRDEFDTLATITCPTLVATGRADSWSPVSQHETIAAAIPGARLDVIEDAGHMVAMEQPAAVTGLLTAWLTNL